MFAFFQLFLKQLAGKGPIGFYIQFFGFILAFGISFLLTNWYSDVVYGRFILVFSTMDMLAVFVMMGYQQLFAIHIPQFGKQSEKIAGLFKRAQKATLRNAFIFMVLLAPVIYFLPMDRDLRILFLAGLVLLPFVSITFLQTHLLYSLKVSVWPQFNERILRGVVFIIVILFCLIYRRENRDVPMAFTVAILLCFLFAYILRQKHFNSTVEAVPFDHRMARQSIFLLVVINLIGVVFAQTDTLMTAFLLDPGYAGVNNVYMKMAATIGLVLSGMMVSSSPLISELVGKQDYIGVRAEIRKITRLSALIGGGILIGIVLLSPSFFNWYNSNLYSLHREALWMYCASSMLDILTGPATVVLMLSGQLKTLIKGYVFELIFNVILNFILIPMFQLEGAALATLMSVLVVNSYFAWSCYRHYKLNTLLFGS